LGSHPRAGPPDGELLDQAKWPQSMESENAGVKIYSEVLSSRQAIQLKAIGPLLAHRGFYLAGGTGLALHLGHRKSIDLDFFSAQPLGDLLVLAKALRGEGVPIVVGTVGRGALHGTLHGIRITLLEYQYANLKRPRRMKEFGCSLASLDDIATMKLSAVAQRGSKKDFIDVYALLMKHAPLNTMLMAYRRRYHLKDTLHVLQALTYFDEADLQRTPTMIWNATWPDIKRRIQESVLKTVRQRSAQR